MGKGIEFLKNLVPHTGEGCVEYTGYRLPQGYGQVTWQGKRTLAHRLVFYLRNGYWPVQVRHTCDNPNCVNPQHLLAGTNQDNMHDMTSRGRQQRWDTHVCAKLTMQDVWDIRRQHIPGKNRHVPSNTLELAQRYGISERQLRAIVRHEKWRDLLEVQDEQ